MTATNPFAAPKADLQAVPLASNKSDQLRKKHLQVEASIQAIGRLWLLSAAICLLMTLIMMLSVIDGPGRSLSTLGLTFLYLSIGGIVGWTGYQTNRLNPQARVPAIALACLGLLAVPVGTLITIYFLILLLGSKGRFIMTEEYLQIVRETSHIKYKTPLLFWLLAVLIIGGLVLGLSSALWA